MQHFDMVAMVWSMINLGILVMENGLLWKGFRVP